VAVPCTLYGVKYFHLDVGRLKRFKVEMLAIQHCNFTIFLPKSFNQPFNITTLQHYNVPKTTPAPS
jgi:hypothetical protein